MQVNSVSLGSNAHSTVFKASMEEQIFATLRDRDLKDLAWAKASKDVNDKKHHAIDNALLLSLPLAGGLSAVAQKIPPEAVAKFGARNIRAVKFACFGLISASWGAGLAALGALWSAKDYLAKKVDIIKNNPVISSIATFALGFGVLAGVDRLGSKGLVKLINSVDGKKVLPLLRKARNFLNNNKFINKASEYMAKFPSPIKDIARGAAEFAPLIVIGTQIAHIFGHQSVKSKVANKNYEDLRLAQQNIRDNIADERIERTPLKKSILDLHEEYEQMLQTKPIKDAKTGEPVTFEQFVKLATTYVK